MIYFLFSKYFSEHGLILRIAGAGVMSFALVLALGPRVIRFLTRSKLGDRVDFDHADLNALGRHKGNVPTMGGVLIVGAIIAGVLMFANLGIMYIKMAILAAVWLGGLGAVDDWIKLRYAAKRGSRQGLYSWEKILFQIGLAVLLAIFLYGYSSQSHTAEKVNPAHQFHFPVLLAPIALAVTPYVITTVLTMVGFSNAVNLTDGMDGLASGCIVIVSGFFLLISWIVGVEQWASYFNMPHVVGSAEMTVLCAAMLGASLGFLWYNALPANVFMGDTGSLPLGGLIGYIAVVTRQELLLIIAGGVFVMEAFSVMLQVTCFKLTKGPGGQGKRIFRCAPIHHHFHLGGWQENKVVVRFWILAIVLAALALATLKFRTD
ncbi:MAG: phospho-N-acetylmuramoyl-pentapeptide-transferase [Planctomycetota bacterium]|nr:phospho-N-acetylmuramoyl-pentapeptide-transferase [Planctomycetota bacterium]